MNKPDLHFKMKLDFVAYLREWIDIQMTSPDSFAADDDKIILAALWEVRQKIAVKLAVGFKQVYNMRLTACQAIALRMLYTSFDIGGNEWFANELRMISDRVHQHYNA